MEYADGFIRTISDASDADSDSDSNASELHFAHHGDLLHKDNFFEAPAAAAWDFASAREQAASLRPFQTSVDSKIRSARNTLREPPSAQDDHVASQRDGADGIDPRNRDADNASKDNVHNRKGDNENVDDDSIDGDSSDEEDNEQTTEVRKGKKRLRKERAISNTTFLDLHLSKPLQKAIAVLEWTKPTPIQARAIPYILAGRDICASAVTGSGKTAAFLLPVLERLIQAGIDNCTRVLVLLPTRELAAQCHAVLTSLSKYTTIRAALAVGGLSGDAQEVALRTRPHIIVATPGRLIDHIHNARGFSLEDIEVLIMDEADRLLEMGFQAEVEEIVRNTPTAKRQTLLFSATMTPGLKGLIKLSLQNPVTLAVDPVLDVATTLEQEFIKLKAAAESTKDAVLMSLVTRSFKTRTIIFFRQKVIAHRFKILFGLARLNAAELHGNLTQAQRLAALDSFRDGTADFLLCTDLAARGLDIAGVETVVNYDMPNETKEYVHRVGRTARAGTRGRACSIVCTAVNEERKLLKVVAKRARGKLVARVVPAGVVGKWKAWIESSDSAVRKVLKEERQEKEMRMAEMEVNKANNMIKHSNEIYSRPARTWFQSEEDKRTEKGKARHELGLGPGKDESSRAEKRKRKALEIEQKRKQEEKMEKEKGFSRQRADARPAKRKRMGKR